jgi:hypothetical protein
VGALAAVVGREAVAELPAGMLEAGAATPAATATASPPAKVAVAVSQWAPASQEALATQWALGAEPH